MKEVKGVLSQPYFIWNGTDSRSMGVKVLAYPPRIRPKERIEYVTIPGVSGDLAIKEGKDVYEPYTRPMELRNDKGFSVEAVRKWLRGSGKMIYGCEPDRIYDVDLGPELQFDRFVCGIWRCTLQMRTQPLKSSAFAQPETLTEAKQIYNGGDVDAYPVILVYPAENADTVTVTVNRNDFVMTGVDGVRRIDCWAQEVTDDDRTALYTVYSSGRFPVLCPGYNSIGGSGWSALEIDREERFL